MTNKTEKLDRQEECDKMVKEAIAQPGVREAMKVFLGWHETDRYLKAAYPYILEEDNSKVTQTSTNKSLD